MVLFLFGINVYPINAQQLHKVKVIVRDSATNQPIVGAHIRNLNNDSRGVVTNSNGESLISVLKGNNLIISHIGYETQSITANSDYYVVKLTSAFSNLDEVLIKARREPPVEVQEKINLFPVSVIDMQRLKNRATNLNEVLSREAGTIIRNTGGLGSASTISLRGLEGNRVAIFLDGSPVNYTDGSFTLNDLPINLIERVEIYKGIIPAELGASGIGGAVNIITKHIDHDYIDINYMLQSYNTHSGSFIYKKVINPTFELGFGGFLNYADNDYTMLSPFQPGLEIRRTHDRYESYGLGLAPKFNNVWFDEVRFEFAYYTNYKEIQGIQQNIQHAHTHSQILQIEAEMEKEHFFSENLSFSYRMLAPIMWSSLVDTSLYRYDFSGDRFISPTGRGELGFYPNQSDNFQQDFQHIANFKYVPKTNHALNLNSVYRLSKNRPDDPLANEFAGQNITTFPADLSSNVTSLSYEFKSGNGKVNAQAGLSYYYFTTNGRNSNILGVGNVEQEEIAYSVSRLGQNLSASYYFTTDLLFKAGFQHAYRLPAPNELYGDGLLQIAAPALRPEQSYNYTLGVMYEHHYGGLRDLKVELNLFHMDLTDMIQLRGNGVTTAFTNVGQARIQGIELEAKYDITENLYSFFNATYQEVWDSQEIRPGTVGVKNPTFGLRLPHIPWFFANYGIEYHVDNLFGTDTQTRAYYESQYVHEFFFEFELSANQDRSIPSAWTHHLGVEHSVWNDKLSLGLELRNITNELVINNFNNPLPGRNFRIKLRYTTF